jgi:predicted P-loop ATPase/GTPase
MEQIMKTDKPAGLTHAPSYDASQDVDDDQVESIQEHTGFDVHKLAYYQELERKRSFTSKMVLMIVMFALIGTVIMLIQDNSEAMNANTAALQERLNNATMERAVVIDQLDQSELQTTLDEILERLESIESSIAIEETD